ncbi:MAG TPA: YicC/YloC family endoribonuclease [Tissierellaceae bacterium]|nr:YicC/YloC family endoribonuclease [Tissierellaceae bacterium]
MNLIRSMTGYGKGEHENQLYRFSVEMKSVNHRYNDIYIRMPKHISYLEEKIKRIIKNEIKRGKIDVFINLEYLEDSAMDVKVDIPLAKSYKSALNELILELDLKDYVKLNNILHMDNVINSERKDVDEEEIEDCLKKAINIGLEQMVNMRMAEGKELKEDMILKLKNVEENLIFIEKRAPNVVLEYKEKLSERIEELLNDDIDLDEDKLNNEVAFFADRSSIDEEIVRLKSHIKQFYLILEEENSIGRKLDFLIQELNREINTIGSKSNDISISKLVVDIKSELEKIREQVQNIE